MNVLYNVARKVLLHARQRSFLAEWLIARCLWLIVENFRNV